jgi:hypothetical protein
MTKMTVWKTSTAALAFAFLIGLTSPGHAGLKEKYEASLKVAQEMSANSQVEFTKLERAIMFIRFAEGAKSAGKYKGCNNQLNKALAILG